MPTAVRKQKGSTWSSAIIDALPYINSENSPALKHTYLDDTVIPGSTLHKLYVRYSPVTLVGSHTD